MKISFRKTAMVLAVFFAGVMAGALVDMAPNASAAGASCRTTMPVCSDSYLDAYVFLPPSVRTVHRTHCVYDAAAKKFSLAAWYD